MDTATRNWSKQVVMIAVAAMLAGLMVMAGANRALAQPPAPGTDGQAATQTPPPPPPPEKAYAPEDARSAGDDGVRPGPPPRRGEGSEGRPMPPRDGHGPQHDGQGPPPRCKGQGGEGQRDEWGPPQDGPGRCNGQGPQGRPDGPRRGEGFQDGRGRMDGPGQHGGPGMQGPPPRPKFEDFDTNRDGVISKEEFEAFRPPRPPMGHGGDRLGPQPTDRGGYREGPPPMDRGGDRQGPPPDDRPAPAAGR